MDNFYQVDAIKTGAREEPEDENENNTSHRDFVGGNDSLQRGLI